MTVCPNCVAPMTQKSVEVVFMSRTVDVDACAACRLFWFDRHESLSLTPRSTLELFQFIGAAATDRVTPLASHFSCPRCQIALMLTRDLQRTTPFTYWRCDAGDGRLISFHQFLREKNFIRTPAPADLAKLRETVRQVSCSQCGAPIDLATDSACSHCGAPIALIDPDSITKALHDLTSQPATTGSPDATRAALIDAQLDALFNLERVRLHSEQAPHVDVLAVGMQAVGALVGAFLRSV